MAFPGGVLDISWSDDSTKIVASGDGKSSMMVKAFAYDTGNTLGEMVGHNRPASSVAFRPVKPFRVMSVGEDNKSVFYHGTPFKFEKSHSCHTGFVNAVRYSNDGSRIVSVSADKKIQFYDGDSGEPTDSIPNAHTGSIYGVSFNPDGSKILTCSADKTVKLWDVASKALEVTFTLSSTPQVSDMQVSTIWLENHLLSLSLSGDINILDPANPDAPKQILSGPQNGACLVAPIAPGVILTGSTDGSIHKYILGENSVSRHPASNPKSICKAVHDASVRAIVCTADTIVSLAGDGVMKTYTKGSLEEIQSTTLDIIPLGACATESGIIVVYSKDAMRVFNGSDQIASKTFGFIASACAIVQSGSGLLIAAGSDDEKTRVYSLDGSNVTETKLVEGRAAVTAIAFTPTGDTIAIGYNNRQIEVYLTDNWDCKIKSKWCFHSGAIVTMAWSPDGSMLVSGGVDDEMYLWNLASPMKKEQVRYVHGGVVKSVAWASDEVVISTGGESSVTTWDLTKN
jgi:WD repeat-containing protein 1 (actin-interacting protein 1)